MTLPSIITKLEPSVEMVALLETPTSPIYGTDNNPNGFDVRETAWIAPVEISRSAKGDAERLLVKAEASSLPASREVVEKWLSSLGALQAGNATDASAEGKITAYASMLDYPAACFTKTTLDVAARTFSPWFPDYGGLAEFLDQYALPIRSMVERLRRIADAPEALPKPEDPEVTRRHEELRAKSEKLRHDSAQEILRLAYGSAGIEVPSGELTNAQFDADMIAHERAQNG